MLQAKFMLFGVVALMAVSSAVAIAGGKDATRGQFPYFAYMECYKLPHISHKGYSKCGGALVSNQWIVTSAQCLDLADGVEVQLGLQRIFDQNENGRQIFNVTKNGFYFHSSYKKELPFIHDIALLKLPTPAKLSKYVQPIRMSSAPISAGTSVTTMGYGLVYTNVFPQNLQYTHFKTIDIQKCGSTLPLNSLPKNSAVCAVGAQSGLCFGDMGNPLVSNSNGKLVGIAVATWGDCEVGPQRYTGILPYIEWINKAINSVGFVQNTPDIHV